eukprot:scaffold4398_cov24-Phaeocystis_antarctica.AAC.1
MCIRDRPCPPRPPTSESPREIEEKPDENQKSKFKKTLTAIHGSQSGLRPGPPATTVDESRS